MSASTPPILPPDRGHIGTEHRNPLSSSFDALETLECVRLMVHDHRRVTDAVAEAADALAALIEDVVASLRSGGRLIYIGAGTSGRLGVLDASECPPTFQASPSQVVGIIAGGDAALRRSSEAMEDDPDGARRELERLGVNERDTLLGIAAGGTTPYVLGAIRTANRCGARTGLLTCAPQASGGVECDHLICLDTGPELLTGSTRLKAGSATKLALNIITTTAFTRIGKVYSNLMVDLRATNAKLTDRALRILVELNPDLSREAAHDLLERAGGGLKTAIVMHNRGIDRTSAERLLEAHHSRLRDVLETPAAS